MKNVNNSVNLNTEKTFDSSNLGLNTRLNYADNTGRNNFSIFSDISSQENNNSMSYTDSVFGVESKKEYYEGDLSFKAGASVSYSNVEQKEEAKGFTFLKDTESQDVSQETGINLKTSANMNINDKTSVGANASFGGNSEGSSYSKFGLNGKYSPTENLNFFSSGSLEHTKNDGVKSINTELNIGGNYELNNSTQIEGVASYETYGSEQSKTKSIELGINKEFKLNERTNLESDAKYKLSDDGIEKSAYSELGVSGEFDLTDNVQLNSSYTLGQDESSKTSEATIGAKFLSDDRDLELDIGYARENVEYSNSDPSEKTQTFKLKAGMNF